MAGDWIKMQRSLLTSGKVVRIMSACDADRLRTIGGLFAAWCLFDEQTEDGILEGYTPKIFDQVVGFDGLCRAMESVGWLEVLENGLKAVNFCEHNGQTARRRAQESVRKMSARDADKMRTESALEKRREEKRRDKSVDGGSGKVLMEFPIRGGGTWELKESLASTLREAYPVIDRRSEYTKAKAWLVANPDSQKTSRGMAKFLNAWLARCKPEPPGTPPEHVPSGEELSRRSREQMAARQAARDAKKATEEVA
jgi:hypothetical protein